MAETVVSESRGAVRLLTITRPEALNAINQELLEQLERQLDAITGDGTVRAVVITGAGSKGFVAGADIRALQRFSAPEAEAFILLGQRVMQQLGTLPQPVIAAVNGVALGGGLELALACDFIYAAEGALLGLVEANLGLLPGFGGVPRLVRRIGEAAAREALYTARRFTASEALACGLINRVCASERLLDEALATAQLVASKSPRATALTKSLVEATRSADPKTLDALERRCFAQVFAGPDARAGITAFLEKRAPVFGER
jgi:enoyl-CoA hydratase